MIVYRGEDRLLTLTGLEAARFDMASGNVADLDEMMKKLGTTREAMVDLEPKGTEQVAAGYILYGSSVVMCLTTGNGVNMFVLDQAIGSFLRVRTHLQLGTRRRAQVLQVLLKALLIC